MNNRKYLRLEDVMDRVGLSRSTVYRQIAAGAFPSPYCLTENRSGWLESEIEEWSASRQKRVNRKLPA